MRHYTVFYGQQIYGEFSHSIHAYELPDGCYIRITGITETSYWCQKIASGFESIDSTDLPKEIKTLCLLMEIH